jgi:predicted transcriptional regulator
MVMTGGAAYRSRCRIYYDILRAIVDTGQAKVTYLLHKANLSHDRLIHHLGRMESLGLLEKRLEGDNAFFVITQKGKKYLIEFRKVEEFGDTFGIMV